MNYEITELYAIMPINNIISVMEHGILSHKDAASLPHSDISMQDVQDRRTRKKIPGGLHLHEYANLYFCARNPMMFKRKSNVENLCVLRVSKSLLSLEGVILTDQNAASDYVRFLNSTEKDDYINFDWVFADDWTDSDQITQWRKASAKCAEALIPHSVKPEYIIGAYVGNTIAKEKLLKIGFKLDIEENKHIFFI